MADRRGGMTLKQVLFTEAYIGAAAGNGAEAARIAGYAGSDATLAQIAYENVQHPEIAARIAERVNAVGMTADEIVIELSKIARAPWDTFIQSVTNRRGEVIEVRMQLADKIRALELLGKYLGLGKDNPDTVINIKALIGVDLDRI